MKINKLSLWEATRTLWTKYCGIADEYKMLRDRWLYLHDKKSMPTLTYLKRPTFAELDKLVNRLSRKFTELGFFGDKIENFERYSRTIRDIGDLAYCSYVFEEIKNMFFDLATYEGLLKLAFFQRTVSAEISHVSSGVPHSPERTIGNELFYLAADKIAQKYNKCLKIGGSRWDGVITFAPPKEATMFYGAFFRPSRYLPLFHISMSEEQKYFVGSYLALAHEFGHATIYANKDIFWVLANWAIGDSIVPHLTSVSKLRGDLKLKQFFDSVQECERCIVYPTPLTVSEKITLYLDFFEDFLADLIAIHIGGLNTAEIFIDEIFRYLIYRINGGPQPEFTLNDRSIVRMSGMLSYLNQIKIKNLSEKRLDSRFKNLIKTSQEFLNLAVRIDNNLDVDKTTMLTDVCTNCILKIGKLWGIMVGKIDQNAQERFDESIFSVFVKDNMFFNLNKNTENRIVRSLLDGVPCPQEDPRYILHAYHEAYKRSKGTKRPNYAATIHSLAFNRYP